MKKTIMMKWIAILLLPVAFLASCTKENDVIFEENFTGIYFELDSINYSFSVTPLDVQNHLLKVPVQIMGSPEGVDRIFGAEVVPDKTTAIEGVHYQISGDLEIPKDSIRGFIPVIINRNSLGTDDFMIRFKLVEKNKFTPVNESFKEVNVVFNNRVERPQWKDWRGNPAWPTFYLGQWNPLTYIKFIELFRAMEDKAPEAYSAMVNLYGDDLANVPSGWPFDYMNTMIKYVTIPLYQYFVEQHPDLGVVIPRPAGY